MSIQNVNIKGADQTGQMRRLVCTFVDHIQQIQVFLGRDPFTVKPVFNSHSEKEDKKMIIASCRSKVLQNAQREHSAIFSTFIKLPFVLKTLVLSIFEWLL